MNDYSNIFKNISFNKYIDTDEYLVNLYKRLDGDESSRLNNIIKYLELTNLLNNLVNFFYLPISSKNLLLCVDYKIIFYNNSSDDILILEYLYEKKLYKELSLFIMKYGDILLFKDYIKDKDDYMLWIESSTTRDVLLNKLKELF